MIQLEGTTVSWRDRGTEVVFLTGERVVMTARLLIAMAIDRLTYIWLIGSVIIVASAATYAPVLPAGRSMILVTTGVTIIAGVISYNSIALVLLLICPRIGWRRVYPFTIALPAAGLMLLVLRSLTVEITGAPAGFGYDLQYFLFMLFFLELVISVFCTFCMESITTRHGLPMPLRALAAVERPKADRSEGIEPPKALPIDTASHEMTVVIQGQLFPYTDILAISAKGKRLVIHTRTEKVILRASFGVAIGLVADCTGILVHRSHWVARAHVVGLHKDGLRNLYVELIDGSLIPVAQSRVTMVREMFAERGAKIEADCN